MILALDQATNCGYAVVDCTGKVVESGVWHLADSKRSGESRGMRYLRFKHRLVDIFLKWPVKLIVHEQTLLRGGAATEIANALKGQILLTAAEQGVEVSCVHTTELKKWFTGSGKAEKYDMVREAEKRLGRKVEDDNEADAVAIGLWSFSQFYQNGRLTLV